MNALLKQECGFDAIHYADSIFNMLCGMNAANAAKLQAEPELSEYYRNVNALRAKEAELREALDDARRSVEALQDSVQRLKERRLTLGMDYE
jgi:chromosome segregation ATPase